MPDFVPAPATLPSGLRIYAIGDVHGCLEKLITLQQDIAEDVAARPIDQAIVLYLGDYVDRGPDTAGVVGRLIDGTGVAGLGAVHLMGNHEDLLLAALDARTPESVPLWMMNGGAESLLSWGIPRTAEPGSWITRIPEAHLGFLRGLSMSHAAGGYLFVHAGLRPDIPITRQTRHDLLWIREPFLSSSFRFGVVVVHGHTPRPKPELRANRIGIDTGAVMGGVLTCAVLEADRVAFISR